MKKIAIIPARGGSKRIPKKNIKDFLGKPIIAYSIESALRSELFDEVMVSTDDEEIASISIRFGAEVPFLRSIETSGDFSSTDDVLKEVVLKYRELGQNFDIICCIYPCTPLITTEILKNSYSAYIKGNFTLLYPVIAYSHPIQRAINLGNDGKIAYLYPENENIRTQDLKTYYHDSGQFYWMNLDYLFKDNFERENTGAIIISELEGQDIDNENDWKLAEMKFMLKTKFK